MGYGAELVGISIIVGGTLVTVTLYIGVGGINIVHTTEFPENILRYNYRPTTGVADLQASLNNMLRISSELLR